MSKKKIVNKLREARDKMAMQTSFDASMKDAEDVVKNTLGSDTPPEEVKDIAAQLATESNDSVGRGIEAGMNPEVEADKYEEYRALMAQLAAEEGGEEQPVREEEGVEPTNDPVKLKQDVEKLMSKLDISSIAPYLAKIDNPVEQAEVIGQFAEKIGVPKAKLSAVVAQLKTVAENRKPKMTKNQLVEAVTGRRVIKTIKVKDIK